MVLQRGPGGRVINPVDSCYYQGNIIGYEKQNIVTVSTCNGLNGLIRTGDNSYTIKQLPASVAPHFVTEYGDYPHVVFRRSTRSGQRTEVTTSLSRHKRGIRDLDAIITQTIELVVMVDSTVYEYFDSSDTLVQDFVLSFVNA
ncbi:disintegrin and metalloproteinase domain-containing protein 32-like, partial [Anneissia japonica]|uniref:disintegrin and metalloproteinase domain-containing protein 32-like n=1 Tax=Anneissia japonica TaxID=1529436 RepID=UPI00142591A9